MCEHDNVIFKGIDYPKIGSYTCQDCQLKIEPIVYHLLKKVYHVWFHPNYKEELEKAISLLNLENLEIWNKIDKNYEKQLYYESSSILDEHFIRAVRYEKNSDEDKRWFLNGKLHREDGPAVEYANGSKYWYINDKLHRVDGPAIERFNGDKLWYINGLVHRENDLPAIEWGDGNKYWYLNGKRHREDGPAVILLNLMKSWYKKGQKHRKDGPAIEWNDGAKEWFSYGKRHRIDGPAIERNSGVREWYKNGKKSEKRNRNN